LENKELLQSLNKTKEKSATITNALQESLKLGEDLDKVGHLIFGSTAINLTGFLGTK
jgi:hypothetical protein